MKFFKLRRILIFSLKTILGFLIFSFFLVLLLKWFNPLITSFMIQDRIEALGKKKEKIPFRYQWVGLKEISSYMQVAVIAGEDQSFLNHHGFDFGAIEKAIKHNQTSKRIQGASTISQQVAKNLFLWSGRSFLRKGLEAYFTALIECIWSKKRILEVYLNIVEMGNHIFGVQAASQYYFNKSAKHLTLGQAALLAAILPNPVRYSPRNPSAYVQSRKNWILRQMHLVGGSEYLKDM